MVVETKQAFVGARLRLSGDNTSFVVRTAGAHARFSIVGTGIFPGAHAAYACFTRIRKTPLYIISMRACV